MPSSATNHAIAGQLAALVGQRTRLGMRESTVLLTGMYRVQAQGGRWALRRKTLS